MRERRPPGGGPQHDCIAFYKGELVDDDVLAWILELAVNGYITEAGMSLYLIPKAVYDQAKRKAPFPSVKKKDCIPLRNFLPKMYSVTKPSNRRNSDSKPLYQRPPEYPTRNAGAPGRGRHKRNKTCLICGSLLQTQRAGAKYCSKGCKQAAYRARRFNAINIVRPDANAPGE